MANENKPTEKKQEQQQPILPTAQAELTDEELKQVVGGGIKVPQSPTVYRDTIIIEE